jgi:DNA-binding SARP family transcriptional activator
MLSGWKPCCGAWLRAESWAALAARRGLHEHALDCGRRILALDPLRESVQREMMLLLVLNGQRADAIHAYQRLRGLLKADLGIEPMPDTRRLHHDIVSGAIFDNIDAYAGSYFGEALAG